MDEKILKLMKYSENKDEKIYKDLNKIFNKTAKPRRKYLLINIKDMEAQVNPDVVEYKEPLKKIEVEDE